MPPTLGAGARRVSAAALRTRYLAASMGGRAAWPTVRHLADKLGTPSLNRIDSGIYRVSSGCDAKYARTWVLILRTSFSRGRELAVTGVTRV